MYVRNFPKNIITFSFGEKMGRKWRENIEAWQMILNRVWPHELTRSAWPIALALAVVIFMTFYFVGGYFTIDVSNYIMVYFLGRPLFILN